MCVFLLNIVLGIITSLTSSLIWDSYKGNKALEKGLKKTYLTALKKYSKNWYTRLTTARSFYSHLEELVNYIKEPNKIKTESSYDKLTTHWHNELKNEIITYNFIIEQIGIETRDIVFTLSKRYNVPFKPFEDIPDYITRLVTVDENKENDFISFNSSYPLFDIITKSYSTDESNNTTNKFILYSAAQRGKTTELNHLANLMYRTGYYLPFLIDLNNFTPVVFIDRMKSIVIEHDNAVLLLDAYDEIKDSDKGYFKKELNLFMVDYPDIIIVISSRANFEDKNNFEKFKPLYLEPLSHEDIHGYIRQHNEDILEPFIEKAYILKVYDLLTTPFYLKSMLKYFSVNNDLPKTKSELYKILIQESFEVDEKHKQEPGYVQRIQTKGYKLLQKIAFVMTVCEKKELDENELLEIVSDDDFQTALHFAIFKRDAAALKYSFEHLAFKEFLVADLLALCPESIVEKLIFYPESNNLINSWYNIVLLFIETVQGNPVKFQSLIDVLIENERHIIVNASPDFLSKADRIDTFKRIFNDYKKKSLYISYYEFRENLMRFANYPETIMFLTEELSESANNATNHNALVLMEYADYDILLNETKEQVKSSLKSFLAKLKDFRELRYYVILPFYNKEFHNEKDIEEIGEIIKDNKQAEVLDHYFVLLLKLEVIDKYAERIFQMQQYIGDYHYNGITHIVNRYTVYQVYGKFESLENITKALNYVASENSDFSRNKEKQISIKKILLQKLREFYFNKVDPNITQSVLTAFVNESFSRYSLNEVELTTVSLYKEFFESVRQVNGVLDDEYDILEDSQLKRRDYKRELIIPLLMTEEYFIRKMKSYDKTDIIGQNIMRTSLPLDIELNKRLSLKLDEYFIVPKPIHRDFDKENQEDFNLVINYQHFKNEIERHCNSECSLIYQNWDLDIRKLAFVSSCLDYFFNQYKKDDGKIDIKAARRAINNLEMYYKFVLHYISQYLVYNDGNYTISVNEHQKEVVCDLISYFIDSDLIEDNLISLLVAISFVDFTLTEEQIVKFMPFSYRIIPNHIGYRYSLKGINDGDVFTTNQTTLLELLIHKSSQMFVTSQLKVMIESDIVFDDSLYLHISRYLTRNKMNTMYSYLPIILYDKIKDESKREKLLYYISSIENSFSLIGSRFVELPDKLKITYFRTLKDKNMPESTCSLLWKIYGRVEGCVKIVCLSELLANGCHNALDEFITYIKDEGKYIDADNFPRLLYVGDEYLDTLLEIFDLILDKVDITYNRISDVVLQPIRETAVLSRKNLDKVRNAFENIIERHNDFHFLNREIITLTNQLYESGKFSWSIREAILKHDELAAAI